MVWWSLLFANIYPWQCFLILLVSTSLFNSNTSTEVILNMYLSSQLQLLGVLSNHNFNFSLSLLLCMKNLIKRELFSKHFSLKIPEKIRFVELVVFRNIGCSWQNLRYFPDHNCKSTEFDSENGLANSPPDPKQKHNEN